MIMAAGLGTRLKPWTDHHPKALVPVEGEPILGRLINKLVTEGFSKIFINVHHFSNQIREYIDLRQWEVPIIISDESAGLLDTGGGLVKVCGLMNPDDGPLLVHNVDILSNQNLTELVNEHQSKGNDITLLTSDRESTRKLIFNKDNGLCGWHNLKNNEYRPATFHPVEGMEENAFSGIYVMDHKALRDLAQYSSSGSIDKFPIMDYLLARPEGIVIKRLHNPRLRVLDVGKPEALSKAYDYI